MNYKIIIDDGKPFEIKVKNQVELKKQLVRLRKKYINSEDEFAYVEVIVLDKKGKDVTNKMFKKFKL